MSEAASSAFRSADCPGSLKKSVIIRMVSFFRVLLHR